MTAALAYVPLTDAKRVFRRLHAHVLEDLKKFREYFGLTYDPTITAIKVFIATDDA